jgi:hypothetical protein
MPSGSYDALSPQLVLIGVWGRAALLIALAVVFLRARVVQVPARRPNELLPEAPRAETELPRPDPIGPPAPSGAPGIGAQG